MPAPTKFHQSPSYDDAQLSEQLELNLVGFTQWALLEAGAFSNITLNSSGAYGGNKSRLRLGEDPNFSQGQVWEGFRRDWVWETGVEHVPAPINISGVYINGTFYPAATTGVYKHHVDYPNGRIVFDAAISTGVQVKCEYSYRLFNVTTPDVPWFRQIQFNSQRVDDAHFLQYGSGVWSMGNARMQLPAIIIEAVPTTRWQPWQIGNLTAKVTQDVLYHVFTEQRRDRGWAHDVITRQYDTTLWGFDKNRLLQEDRFPLTADGARASGALMYPDLVKPSGEGGYQWRGLHFVSTRSTEQDTFPPLYWATVRMGVEVFVP